MGRMNAGEDPSREMGAARALEDELEFEAAALVYTAILSKEPSHRPARRRLGKCLFSMRRWDEAVHEFRILRHHEPDNAGDCCSLGCALACMGCWSESAAVYRDWLETRPANARILTDLAIVLGQLGESDAGLEMLRRALALSPDYSYAHFTLAERYERSCLYEAAVREYRGVSAGDHRFANAQLHLGLCLVHCHRDDEAAPVLQDVIRRSKNETAVHLTLAGCLFRLRRWNEAVDALDSAPKELCSRLPVRWFRAECIAHTGAPAQRLGGYAMSCVLSGALSLSASRDAVLKLCARRHG